MSDVIKILVVDDQRVIGDLFKIILESKGHKVTFTDNSFKVPELIQNEKFDIVFVDIVMPLRDGIEVLREIKSLSPHLPVVIMSGYSLSQQKEQAILLGAIAYLQKPFQMEDIAGLIKDATDKDV